MCVWEDRIWNAIKRALCPHSGKIKDNLRKKKGVEEVFYPYLNAELCRVLNICKVYRIGSGRLNEISDFKYDIVLEIERASKQIMLLEFKLAEGINNLLFGYQSGKTKKDAGERLARFVKGEQLFGIKEYCNSKARGRSFISDGLLVDIAKIVYAMDKENDVSCGIAIGILMDSSCNGEYLKKVLESICENLPKFFEGENFSVPQFSYKCYSLDDDLELIGVFMDKIEEDYGEGR